MLDVECKECKQGFFILLYKDFLYKDFLFKLSFLE
jgi:hypothetical protein